MVITPLSPKKVKEKRYEKHYRGAQLRQYEAQNSEFEDNESVQRELRTISENEDWLTDHLAGEEKKRSLNFADAWSAFNGDSTLDGFITGFRLGAWFILDSFLSKPPYSGCLKNEE